ncbi:MAG: UDP-N-acetylglucosamine--N-acetylmuramyl-(pentapeptide) pyrophosphoryl-undecaprenol N-acetylglucosamine transferase [Pauljensenia sp.]
MNPTIVLAGGGTAGHVNPLLATADALRARGCAIVVLGTSQGLESDLVPAAGYHLVTIPKVPLPRRPSVALLTLPSRMHEAVREARAAMGGADVLVGFGGYVSTPAYRAARTLGLPVVVQEQNARPGLANRLGARHAAVVALTFPSTPLRAVHGRTVVTGLPLRPAIADLAAIRSSEGGRVEARRAAAGRLDLDPDLRTLVITGGSLGAQHLNEVMCEVATDLPAGTQVLHLTGRGKDTPVRSAVEQAGVAERWKVLDYLTTMEDALAVADLVVCRSGAGTVAELTALGLPAFYVPLPIGNGEQRLNAADHVATGGARLVVDHDFTPEVARTQLLPLLVSDELARMGRASQEHARTDGAETLADLVLAQVGTGDPQTGNGKDHDHGH